MLLLASRIDRGLNRLYGYSGAIAALCLMAIGLLVMASIVSRLLSLYVPGLTEYSGYAMAASSFFGLSYTFRENGHIRVELFIGRLGPRTRHVAEIWCLAVAAVVTWYLAWYLGRMTWFSWRFEEHSEGADAVLLWKPQLVVVIGAVLLAIAVLHRLVRSLAGADRAAGNE